MQTRFLTPVGPSAPRQVALFVFMAMALVPLSTKATDPMYINYGNLFVPPQIDASNVVNYGSFNFGTITVLPFQTANTHNFTNYGSMFGNAGFWFNNASAVDNSREPADNFVNKNTGLVESFDVASFGGLIPVVPNYVWVQAHNVINQGLLEVGSGGELKIEGSDVNLARSGLEVQAIQGVGSFNFPPFFFPDAGIYDLFWDQTNLISNSDGIWNGRNAVSPFGIAAVPPLVADSYVATNLSFILTVTNIIGYPNPLPIVITNVLPTNILITNILFPSNVVRQAAFVGLNDTNVQTASIHFYPSSNFTNAFKTIAVWMTYLTTNVVEAAAQSQDLFLFDTLAAETNRGIYQNFIYGTGRPANYNLTRLDDGTYFFGRPGNNGFPAPNFFFDLNTFSNDVVEMDYGAYVAFVDNLVAEPPAIPAGTVTNLPGRIRVSADTLDMHNARFRGEGEVMIQANHLVSSTNAVVDCQNLSYTLSSTNGNLNMLNLAKSSVVRLRGDLLAWSGLWTNTMTVLYSNNYIITNIVDTNNVVIGTNAIQDPLTNTISLGLHVLIVNAAPLGQTIPVTTYELVLHSTNILISDTVRPAHSFLVDGQSFTLVGNLSLINDLQDWVGTNAPHLQYFTNRGTLSIPNTAHFGDDLPIPYAGFVNSTGTIQAASMAIDSTYFENGGVFNVGGTLNIQGVNGKLENGSSFSAGLQISANTLKLRNYQASSRGGLWLDVSGALYDAGGGSSNLMSVQDGLTLVRKPATGDLLGTTVQTIAPNFAQVNHFWAGEDRGAIAAGFSNNVALGKLAVVLAGTGGPLFFFSGTGAANGLYVDLLDLSGLPANYRDYLQIDPSLNIYFAAAKVPGTIPPNGAGIPQEAEEYLDGQFGGHLHWVRTFAGPNSSVAVLVNGQTVTYNAALRFSKIIDSDGDGIPNYYDTTPFGGVALTAALVAQSAPQTYALDISWNAAPGKVYQLEYATDLAQPLWHPLLIYTNNLPTNGVVTIRDTNVPLGVRRFYRVGYSP